MEPRASYALQPYDCLWERTRYLGCENATRHAHPLLNLGLSSQSLIHFVGNRVVLTCEGPKWRTRDGGSEWEPIKILFKNSAYEADFTRAPLQASLAKFT
jgi:hypothetical protein